jgi:hypothetical protein
MADVVILPCYSLKPDSLTIFSRLETNKLNAKQLETHKNLDNNENKYNELSHHARKRLQKALDFMIYRANNKQINGSDVKNKQIGTEITYQKGNKRDTSLDYKITFVTLTLSAQQIHSDEDIKKYMLKYFLRYLREKEKVTDYVWKAEKQQNGNIHFHILTNKYIPWQNIRSEWNRLQNKEGFNYVDKYSANMNEYFKNGFKVFPNDERSRTEQYTVYKKNKLINWTNPNSTDIHAIYKINNIAAYMSKYMSKGVTKSDRVLKMKELYDLIALKELQIDGLGSEQAFLNRNDSVYKSNNQFIEDSHLVIKKCYDELEVLKAQGVSGRIWGQSRSLSKLTNYSEVEEFHNIPDIELVKQLKRHKSVLNLGSFEIITYYFPISKTPNLKKILDNHIELCVNYVEKPKEIVKLINNNPFIGEIKSLQVPLQKELF